MVKGCLFLLLAVAAGGCGKSDPPGPTYADAVTIYTAEQAELDRLQKEHDGFVAKSESDIQGLASDAKTAWDIGMLRAKTQDEKDKVQEAYTKEMKEVEEISKITGKKDRLKAAVDRQRIIVEQAKKARDAARPPSQ